MSGRICLILLCAIIFAGTPASGDEILTVTADSTMDGNAGVLLEIQDPPGTLAETQFLITQAANIRVYATRPAGSPDWTVHPVPIYMVPKNKIDPGDTWRYLDEHDGGETIAEAIIEELVDTPAGTFLAWRVDVVRTSNPAKLVRSVWFTSDLGIVRQAEYFDQWIQWEGLLDTYSAAGNGHFPLIVGNTWWLLTGAVSNEPTSMSTVKGQFRDQ